MTFPMFSRLVLLSGGSYILQALRCSFFLLFVGFLNTTPPDKNRGFVEVSFSNLFFFSDVFLSRKYEKNTFPCLLLSRGIR